jgi:hypothetical protein
MHSYMEGDADTGAGFWQQPLVPDSVTWLTIVNVGYIAQVGVTELELQGSSVGGNVSAMIEESDRRFAEYRGARDT